MSANGTKGRRVVVSAPAGSGKTTRLVREYLAALQTSAPERIVAITFTRKAAAELAERIGRVLATIGGVPGVEPMKPAELEPYVSAELDPALCRRALASLPGAPIGTVDAFVLDVLNRHLLHAQFRIGEEAVYLDGPLQLESSPLAVYEEAARELLEERPEAAQGLLAHGNATEVARALARLAAQRSLELREGAALLAAFERRLLELVPKDPAAFGQLDVKINKPGGPFAAGVVEWLRAGRGPAPDGALHWAMGVSKSNAEALFIATRQAFDAACVDAELPSGGGLPAKLAPGWAARASLQEADAVRREAAALSRDVRALGLRAMAASGRLGYDELLLAATELLRREGPQVANAWDALLIDEVQDTSPSQLELYRAIEAARPALRLFHVGDARQSIFRFRGADVHGWSRLWSEAPASAREELRENYRSSARLVAVHEALFQRLSELEGAEALPALPTGFCSGGGPPGDGLLHGTSHEAPVVVVDAKKGPDAPALRLFSQRLHERWKVAPEESAAVLSRSWADARSAVKLLLALGLQAQLTGERTLLAGRIAEDVRVVLRAMLEPYDDDVAVAALWKLPSVGLTDRALVQLRAHGPLARALDSDEPLASLSPDDAAALSRALPLPRAPAPARLPQPPGPRIDRRAARAPLRGDRAAPDAAGRTRRRERARARFARGAARARARCRARRRRSARRARRARSGGRG